MVSVLLWLFSVAHSFWRLLRVLSTLRRGHRYDAVGIPGRLGLEWEKNAHMVGPIADDGTHATDQEVLPREAYICTSYVREAAGLQGGTVLANGGSYCRARGSGIVR